MLHKGVHSSKGLEGGSIHKIYDVQYYQLREKPERSLDEGTEWVVGHSTESVDFSQLQLMSLYPSLENNPFTT